MIPNEFWYKSVMRSGRMQSGVNTSCGAGRDVIGIEVGERLCASLVCMLEGDWIVFDFQLFVSELKGGRECVLRFSEKECL